MPLYDHSQYITTPEEYSKQEYEGSSTLYGPLTLPAYQEIFANLAISIRDGATVDEGVDRSGTSAANNNRITFRNKCSTDASIDIFDSGDLLVLVPRILPSVSSVPSKSDLFYDNKNDFGPLSDIKIKLKFGDKVYPIGSKDNPIRTGDMVTFYENRRGECILGNKGQCQAGSTSH